MEERQCGYRRRHQQHPGALSLAFTDAANYSVHISNNVGATNSVSVPLVVLAAPTNAPAIPGLVLHLTFDGNLTDVTGRGNNGTVCTSPPRRRML